MTKDQARKQYLEDRSVTNRNRVAEFYLPLLSAVAKAVMQKTPAEFTLDDLASMGAVGLLDTIDKYDPDKCPRFLTYAWQRVYGAVIDAFG